MFVEGKGPARGEPKAVLEEEAPDCHADCQDGHRKQSEFGVFQLHEASLHALSFGAEEYVVRYLDST